MVCKFGCVSVILWGQVHHTKKALSKFPMTNCKQTTHSKQVKKSDRDGKRVTPTQARAPSDVGQCGNNTCHISQLKNNAKVSTVYPHPHSLKQLYMTGLILRGTQNGDRSGAGSQKPSPFVALICQTADLEGGQRRCCDSRRETLLLFNTDEATCGADSPCKSKEQRANVCD